MKPKDKKSVSIHIIADPKLIKTIDETNRCFKEVIGLLKLNGEHLIKVFNRSLKIVQ